MITLQNKPIKDPTQNQIIRLQNLEFTTSKNFTLFTIANL